MLDLRGNGGGLVREAQLVASEFLARGEIVTTRGRGVPDRTLSAVGEPAAGDLPVVVLVDEGTASSAEIVTGALRDHERATIVGETTFGKGVFQTVLPLANGGALNLTTGRYFTPDGSNLAGDGIAATPSAAPAANDLPSALRVGLARARVELRVPVKVARLLPRRRHDALSTAALSSSLLMSERPGTSRSLACS